MTPVSEPFNDDEGESGQWSSITITIGDDCIGTILNCGELGVEAFSADNVSLGMFADKAAAEPALFDRWYTKRQSNGGDAVIPEVHSCAQCHLDPPDGNERQSAYNDAWLHPHCVEAFIRARMAEEGLPGDTPASGNGGDPSSVHADPKLKPPPEADRAQLGTFVQELFKHATAGTHVSLRTFPDQNNSNSKPCRITTVKLNGDLEILIDRAFGDAELAARNHAKVVFCPPIATFNNSRHAREQDLAEGLVLSTECDKAAAAARAKLEAVLGPATIVVASGGEWMNPVTGEVEPKLHNHYRLKAPARSKTEHRMLKEARRLAAMLVGADRSNVPICHPIRWPGSLHRKKEPKLCRIIACNPDAEINLAWALERLRAAVEAEGFTAGGSAKSNGDTASSNLRAPCIEAVISALAIIPNKEVEWDEWNYVGMAVHGAAAGSDEGGEAFTTWSARSKKNDPSTTQTRWQHYQTSPPNRIGYGTLVYLARKVQPDWEYITARESTGTDKKVSLPSEEAPLHSEEALALAFAERHADTLRYVAKWGHWRIWDGTCWRTDETRKVYTLARELCRETAATANKLHERRRIASAKTRAAVVSLAGEDHRLTATIEQWDTNPWLLNTPDGTVDLRTGKLREHRITDYMTKQTAVSPKGKCARWLTFMQEITNNDRTLQDYQQRVSGYFLTGVTNEHELYFFYGSGRNGKGVWILTVSGIMHDYHRSTPIETFTVARGERHPTDLAGLMGARLVTAAETEEGRRWSEARIKAVTGGDMISARFMRQDFFDFFPQFKPLFAGNTMPKLRTVNKAITSRFKRIPFAMTIPDERINKNLAEELKAEWPGILAWMIEGCLEWQRIGLCPPKAVTDATESYLDNEDVIGEWIDECCVSDTNTWESSASLFSSWKGWSVVREEQIGSVTDFTKKLEDRGFKRQKNPEQTKRGFAGLRLKAPAETAKNKIDAPPQSKEGDDPDVAELLSLSKG